MKDLQGILAQDHSEIGKYLFCKCYLESGPIMAHDPKHQWVCLWTLPQWKRDIVWRLAGSVCYHGRHRILEKGLAFLVAVEGALEFLTQDLRSLWLELTGEKSLRDQLWKRSHRILGHPSHAWVIPACDSSLLLSVSLGWSRQVCHQFALVQTKLW